MADHFIIDDGFCRYKLPKQGWVNRGTPDKDSPIHLIDLNGTCGHLHCRKGNWHARITLDRKFVTCPECLEKMASRPGSYEWTESQIENAIKRVEDRDAAILADSYLPSIFVEV